MRTPNLRVRNCWYGAGCPCDRVCSVCQHGKHHHVRRNPHASTYLIFRCVVYIITDACVYAVRLSATSTSSHQTTALIASAYHRTAVLGREALLAVTTVKTRGQIFGKSCNRRRCGVCWRSSASSLGLIDHQRLGWCYGDNPFVQQLMYYVDRVDSRESRHPSRSVVLPPHDPVQQRVLRYWLAQQCRSADGDIQEGSEGAMVGLTLSLYFLVVSLCRPTRWAFEGSNFYDVAAVAADTTGARGDVLKALILNYGINALSMFGLFFLPRKNWILSMCERCYRDICRHPFLYSFSISIMTFVPGTACIRINGGAGC
ncbi:hypothetical protein GQ600_25567 [Phytophthora cactorum]|nr:hypothetical protein GQ600_25567 [Phytophthora cactorum]